MGLATVGCTACGLPQTNPRLTRAALDDFYRTSYRRFYQGVVAPDEAYVKARRKDERMAALAATLVARGLAGPATTVLDVGCSEGALFDALRAAGVGGAFAGVEPNAEFRRYTAERHGAAVVASEFELPERLHGTIGLVTLIHVLEHLESPVASLARLRAFTRDGGALYVDVPDAAAYGSVNDLHIAHVFHYTEATLRATVEAAGWTVEWLERHAPPHHPKSVRVVARPGPARSPHDIDDRSAWPPLRAIERDRWRLALKRLGKRLVGGR